MLRDGGDLDRLDFERGGGLVTVVAQDARTGSVLMLAHADRTALERTLESGEMWYWSRSRGEHWHKGATSGSTQRVIALFGDCDGDAVLALVVPAGPACHTGAATCFDGLPVLAELARTLDARAGGAAGGASYTRRLLDDENLRAKKLGEEAAELVLACARGQPQRVAEEAADLIYHTLVAARAAGVDLAAIVSVLAGRASPAAGPRPPGR
jgi:phosphoribosyl-AMP cyclohydrolase / phosphoribosyl-ATP pyrophosphohydrolase